ncbi:type II toxin-antitoxin system Phd/YefM family antitoxin [Shumkonia mesophila]|uniref:type II toxin-antitoxin system Phd/YefM family antitoxin n=1 Tax=Shumkonia mesophila TaxID=2838854 RepID=UPI00293430C7|nr:type II toxin-antitoxin system prevent-host-death family antitoxin [Shumkonia mesophila]
MKTVGSYEAKTHLPRLLEEVERGAEITITRHGKAVARLVPVAERVDERRLKETVESLKRFRRGRHLGGATIKEIIEEGRR